MTRVGKPPKEEAAGVLDHPMGKLRRRAEAAAASGVRLKVRIVAQTGVNSFDDPDKAARFGVIAAVCRAEDGQAQSVRAGPVGWHRWHCLASDRRVSCGLLPGRCARHRFLPAAEDLDDAHWATATGARFAQSEWDDLGFGSWRDGLFRTLDAQQGADL